MSNVVQISSTSTNPAPISWVEKLFGHMQALYGNKFIDMWRDTDIKLVKDLWADEMGKLSGAEFVQARFMQFEAIDAQTFRVKLEDPDRTDVIKQAFEGKPGVKNLSASTFGALRARAIGPAWRWRAG